ncbi:MAG: CRTAC1 family protein [bacterium]|nr:CRTAC1 family protein [bacterium]
MYPHHGDSLFLDPTVLAGLAVVTRYVGWGTAFLDFDNDGWKDVFVANGHVAPSVDGTPINETFRQPRLLFWNRGDGQFHPVSRGAGPAFRAVHASRGVAVGDLDNDGGVEIVVVNMHQRPSLLKNLGHQGNSLVVRLLTPSGRDAVGGRISVITGGRIWIDEVRSGGNYMSQSDFRLHFGLGPETAADVEVRWPSGEREKFGSIAANQFVTIQKGKGIVRTEEMR